MAFLRLDIDLYQSPDLLFRVSHLLLLLLVIQFSRILYWFLTHFYIHSKFANRDKVQEAQMEHSMDGEKSINGIIRNIVIVVAIIFLLNSFGLDKVLYQNQINDELIIFRISGIFFAFLTILIAQLIVWVATQLILYGAYRNKKVNRGAQFAINQLLKYIIYIFAFVIILENLGINVTILLGGAAALLVGVGLGLQQTFNDFISGIVLLFERTVAVGDVLEVDDTVGVVKKIGMRASTIETRGNITVLIPNSKLVNEPITNWTHYDDKVRFDISLSVAYGSDTALVKKILLKVANSSPYIIDYPAPFVRFVDFGDSGLHFILYFFSRNFIVIEDIKSDLRFKIDQLFRENGITIPFPQRELWINTPDKEDGEQ